MNLRVEGFKSIKFVLEEQRGSEGNCGFKKPLKNDRREHQIQGKFPPDLIVESRGKSAPVRHGL